MLRVAVVLLAGACGGPAKTSPPPPSNTAPTTKSPPENERAEANAMGRFADAICACSTVACARPHYDTAVAWSMQSQGKSVTKRAAEAYREGGERLSKCWMDLLSNAPDKP